MQYCSEKIQKKPDFVMLFFDSLNEAKRAKKARLSKSSFEKAKLVTLHCSNEHLWCAVKLASSDINAPVFVAYRCRNRGTKYSKQCFALRGTSGCRCWTLTQPLSNKDQQCYSSVIITLCRYFCSA